MDAFKSLFVGIDEHENEAVTAYDAIKKFYDLLQASLNSSMNLS